jgi:D-serine deaminase-like pyridoxal phosphate-dependent protein
VDALELDTPAVYVDLDLLEANIAEMQARCRRFGVALRPHAKTHKIAAIARLQLDAGAIGLTVAKLGEAEVLPGDDVLVAYPIMRPKQARLRALVEAGRRVTVVVDSRAAAEVANDAGAGALVEVDVGVGRLGLATPEAVLGMARACAHFRGIFYWPSWLDADGFRRASALVEECKAALRSAGLAPEIVSGGSTPGASKTPLIPATTEIRPGTYVFNDASCVAHGDARIEDCALRVLTTVVSDAVPGQCVLDGGSKTLSSDTTVGPGGHGLIVDRPGWHVKKLNEEHAYVDVSGGPAPVVGEKVWVVPSHVCPAINLHDEVAYGRRGRVDGFWRVTARGRVR